MKKLLSAILACTAPIWLAAQPINISTGTDAGGKRLADGTICNWKVNTGTGNITAVTAAQKQQRQAAGCNAEWITPVWRADTRANSNYTYEKVILVPEGTESMLLSLRVACKGRLKSLEIVSPDSVVTVLPLPAALFRRFSKPVKYYFKYPWAGKWTVRAKVRHNSNGRFLLCGTADLQQTEYCQVQEGQCTPVFKEESFTLNAQGNVTVNIIPVVTAGAEHYWGAMSAAGINDSLPVMLSTIKEGRSFGLSISRNSFSTPVGMGTGITGGNSAYGYRYDDIAPGICFKITHYVKCCSRWYSQTNVYCTKLSADTDGQVLKVTTNAGIPKQLPVAKE
jgi:hypothetical protein